MTQEMDYQAEVKKVYPDAYCIKVMTAFFVKDDEYGGGLSGLRLSESGAWESAYCKIQSKITQPNDTLQNK